MSADDNKDEEEEIHHGDAEYAEREKREEFCKHFPTSAPPRRNYGCFSPEGHEEQSRDQEHKETSTDTKGTKLEYRTIRSFVAFASFVVRPSYEYGD